MTQWQNAGSTEQLSPGQRGCLKFGDAQIALFHFEEGNWYAVQNKCPHKKQNVISRGILGDKGGEPKVACALHKNQFSLNDGKCLSGDLESLQVYPVKIEGKDLFIGLP